MAKQEVPLMETICFGAGCFWHVEEAFARLPGVQTATGYGGGRTPHPTYADVCAGTTGHAELVQVRYDPAQIPLERLLAAFWRLHDPTAVAGTQYRSAIFCTTREQLQAAEFSARRHAYGMRLKRPMRTEIAPAPTFWRAEEEHQRFYSKQRAKRVVP